MTGYLYNKEIRIFDYPKFAEPYRNRITEHIKRLAGESNTEIEFISKKSIRKESLAAEKLKSRGSAAGVACILSAMESCDTCKPWYNRQTGKTYVRPDRGKCLHYCVYFIDGEPGFGYMRIPTRCPFRLQDYINGHNLLAREPDREEIKYTMPDNSFDSLSDPVRARELSDNLSVGKIHRRLEDLTWRFCPLYKELDLRYRRNVMQVEYATDAVFRRQEDPQSIYGEIVATAIHTVKPKDISSFFGRKLSPLYEGESVTIIKFA